MESSRCKARTCLYTYTMWWGGDVKLRMLSYSPYRDMCLMCLGHGTTCLWLIMVVLCCLADSPKGHAESTQISKSLIFWWMCILRAIWEFLQILLLPASSIEWFVCVFILLDGWCHWECSFYAEVGNVEEDMDQKPTQMGHCITRTQVVFQETATNAGFQLTWTQLNFHHITWMPSAHIFHWWSSKHLDTGKCCMCVCIFFNVHQGRHWHQPCNTWQLYSWDEWDGSWWSHEMLRHVLM